MKALFLSNDPSIFTEGSGTRIRMREYAERFGELHILARSSHTAIIGDGPLHLHGVRCFKGWAPLVLASRARRLIRSEGITIVSAQDPFEHGWAARRAVRSTRAALHVQIHTDFLSPWFVDARGVSSLRMRLLNRLRVHIARTVLPHASGIRVVSKRIKDSLVVAYGNKLTCEPVVIPLTVSPTVPAKGVLPGERFPFTLVTASRLEPEKRIEDILDALARVRDRYPGAGLFVIGRGREEKRLRRLAHTLGLDSRVRFISEWRADAWQLMQDANAFIQASAYEGYGRTLLEAALGRVPIITTDVGIVGEVFTGYRDVLAVPPGDPAALAVQIMGLIEDEQARHSLVLNAEQAARAHLAGLPPLAEAVQEDLEATSRRGQNLAPSEGVIAGT